MRRGAWVAIVVVALVIASPFVLTAPLPSGSIRDVADRFEPQGAGKVGSDSFEPRRLVCLGDNPCPSVARAWTSDTPITTEQLQQWLDGAGYQATVDGDCAMESCRALGTSDGWQIDVLVFTPYAANGQVRVTLNVKG